MTKYLLISSFVLFFISCSTPFSVKRGESVSLANAPVWTDDLRQVDKKNSYQVNISVRGNTISGICILKKNEGSWRGTLINEFGAKAFDFVVTKNKCELLNTISFMDKWYIRKTIAADLHYLFEIDNPDASFQKHTIRYKQNDTLLVGYKKKKLITRLPNGNLTLRNQKYKILYAFNKISE